MYHQFKQSLSYLAIFAVVVSGLTLVTTEVFAANSKAKSSNSKKAKPKAKSKSRTAKCHSNYSGCVPVASDVDCKPGRGNGPKYISKPVKVLKKDVYRLDADKDRIACERN